MKTNATQSQTHFQASSTEPNIPLCANTTNTGNIILTMPRINAKLDFPLLRLFCAHSCQFSRFSQFTKPLLCLFSVSSLFLLCLFSVSSPSYLRHMSVYQTDMGRISVRSSSYKGTPKDNSFCQNRPIYRYTKANALTFISPT